MRLLLVEDDIPVASFILKGLKSEGFIVDHALSGEDGFIMALNRPYDVAIIDIILPGMDGFTLIQKIREEEVNFPILVLSARRSVDDRVKGLRIGSDDYLTKPFAFSELLARIHALIRRAKGITESANLTFLTYGDLSLNLITREVKRGGVSIYLQPKEFSLLEYLMRNAERIVSKTMIIENVWHYNFDPQTNVVEARMSKLREKIDKRFSKKLIHTIRGVGYVLKDEETA